MTRHSKNNTAGAYFTAAEKNKLSYGTQVERIGNDSLRPPTSCNICLQTAVDPVACSEGHLFCRECILSGILNQKQRLQAQLKKQSEITRKRHLEENESLREAHKRKIEEFEALNNGRLGVKQEKAKESEVNAFWIPAKAPIERTMTIEGVDKGIYCLAKKHQISTKQLIAISWKKDDVGACICGICLKSITQAGGLMIIKSCGHVFCTKCLSNVFTEDSRVECFNCGKSVDKHADLMEMAVDGSGYASSGSKIEVKRYGPAFI